MLKLYEFEHGDFTDSEIKEHPSVFNGIYSDDMQCGICRYYELRLYVIAGSREEARKKMLLDEAGLCSDCIALDIVADYNLARRDQYDQHQVREV